MIRLLLPASFAVLALCGCSRDQGAGDANSNREPAVTGAPGDPLMTDPDLASQNRNGAAPGGGGRAAGEIPPYLQSIEEIERAKDEALRLLGGMVKPVPHNSAIEPASPRTKAVTLPALVAASGLATHNCADKMGNSAAWAARLAPVVAIYPRSHITQAAGADEPDCQLRAAIFVTPVGISDVLAFYNTRALNGGWSVQFRHEGTDEVLRASRAGSRFVLLVRKLESGMTEADLISSGI